MSGLMCMHDVALVTCPACSPAPHKSRLIDPSTGTPFELLKKFPRADLARRAFDVSNENLKQVFPHMPRRERRERARREAKKLMQRWLGEATA